MSEFSRADSFNKRHAEHVIAKQNKLYFGVLGSSEDRRNVALCDLCSLCFGSEELGRRSLWPDSTPPSFNFLSPYLLLLVIQFFSLPLFLQGQ